jgi:hypothetical protein
VSIFLTSPNFSTCIKLKPMVGVGFSSFFGQICSHVIGDISIDICL